MAKIKFTKGELKRQRDYLKQYERYLPTLQLKKQQLQMEIQHNLRLLEEKENDFQKKRQRVLSWAGLLSEAPEELMAWLKPKDIQTTNKNIAGIDLLILANIEFQEVEYDLFLFPLWLDSALESLRGLIFLREEMKIIRDGISILRHELTVTAQRLNLFEKVKIPEAKENIRLIKIYIGDQMANAVGRSKIAKAKIEKALLQEVLA